MSRASSPAIRIATVLYFLTGIGGGLGNMAILAYWIRYGDVPVVAGIGLNGGGVSWGHPGSRRFVWFQGLFIIACGLDVLAGTWLRQSRRRGGVLGLAMAPIGLAFGAGFEVPFWLIVAPLRAVLIGLGWQTLRR